MTFSTNCVSVILIFLFTKEDVESCIPLGVVELKFKKKNVSFIKEDVVSRTESEKLNYFSSNFKSLVSKLCTISL